ncbi:MAG: hypothetical protein COT74_06945 [Bdellovibrionales bacterium CG10_big_fil_rev_8_21_14_0_10_45_34]|nr:MAG: hypothetical protein COT74_06945 [Bdellovibrionales bacterium CG10_big_fil_rev_8_21_14_0_10_45_34]
MKPFAHLAKTLTCLFALVLSGGATICQGQSKGQSKSRDSSYINLHLGPTLPNQIDGVTEILPSWGARYGFPIFSGYLLESGAIISRGKGTHAYDFHTSIRSDMDINGYLMAIMYLGADFHYYAPPHSDFHSAFGGHVGIGITAPIIDSIWIRSDMKFNINPGTSLYIGFGLEMPI